MPNTEKFLLKFDPIEETECFHKNCTFRGSDVHGLYQHYASLHSMDKTFRSPCLFTKHCFHTQVFKSFPALKAHIRTYHESFFPRTHDVSAIALQEQETGSSQHANDNVDVTYTFDHEAVTLSARASTQSDEMKITLNDLKQQSGNFLLSLLAHNKITEASTVAVLPYVQNLVEYTFKYSVAQLRTALTDSSSNDSFEVLNDIKLPVLFSGLQSNKQQMQWISKHFKLVEATEYNFSALCKEKPQKSDQQYFSKQTMAFVSILEQLEQILNVEDVYNEIFENESDSLREDGVYSHFRHGDKFKSSQFLTQNPKSLLLLLYLDEVQLCNPLGSKTQHKLVFVYFTLLNFPARSRSSLKTVFLVAIYYAKLSKEHGNAIVLKPILEELRKLEAGVYFELANRRKKVYGYLVAIVADNLASHEVGGFKAGFSTTTFRRCRTCLAVHEEMQTSFCDLNLKYRSVEGHEEHCRLLLTPTLFEHFSKTYGVTHRSIFNELNHFNVIGGLPPDIMHDLLEGIVPFVVLITIKSLLTNGKEGFQLKDLNFAITNFAYGSNEIRDKPSEISKAHLDNEKLRQTSSQIWTLMVLLPIMVIDIVPPFVEESPTWVMLKNLIKISQIVFSEELTNYDLLILRYTVSDFLENIKELNLAVTPKMHNLVHYVHYILKMGPLRQYWCMRFEAKHSYFKTLVRTCGNFKNLPFTLAKRHQLWMLKQTVDSQNRFLQQDVTISSSVPVPTGQLAYHDQLSELLTNQQQQSLPLKHLQALKWIQVNSTKLHRNKTIIICPVENANVKNKFGLIVGLFISGEDKKNILLACKLFDTVCYNDRYESFEVVVKDEYYVTWLPSLVLLKTFSCHRPPMFLKSNSKTDHFVIVTKENYRGQLLEDMFG